MAYNKTKNKLAFKIIIINLLEIEGSSWKNLHCFYARLQVDLRLAPKTHLEEVEEE